MEGVKLQVHNILNTARKGRCTAHYRIITAVMKATLESSTSVTLSYSETASCSSCREKVQV